MARLSFGVKIVSGEYLFLVSEESAVDHSIILPPGEVAMRLDRVPMLQSDRVTSPMAALLQHTTYIITSHHIYLMKSLTFRTFV